MLKLVTEESYVILVSLCYYSLALRIEIFREVVFSLSHSRLQMRKFLRWNSRQVADLPEVIREMLVADDEIDTQLVIDKIEAVIVGPVASYIFGK